MIKRIPRSPALPFFFLSVIAAVSACAGGGSPSGSFPVKAAQPKPAATALGTPTGPAATAVVGPAGGALSSPDGKLTVRIPAGALNAERAIGIQPITNFAHGGIGGGFRLMPEGATFPQPVQLRFAYADSDMEGASADVLGIAFQDAQGYWRPVPDAIVDKTAKTVTVFTTHFSDWSRVKGAQIRPPVARVKVGKSVALQAMYCMPPRTPPPSDGGEELAPLPGFTCDRAQGALTAFVKNWSVNGIVGGNSTVGAVRGNTDGTSATYTAPSRKPSPATVAVSAEIVGGEKTLLVSNITIEDGANYAGAVQFSMTSVGGTEVSGSANVSWTEFEDPEEEEGAKWYLPSGTITANINMPNCDPLHVAGPIATGSSQDRSGASLTIFPVNHVSQPSQYFFGLVGDRNNNINLYCGRPPNRTRISVSLSHFVNFTIAQCGDSHEPYTDTKLLRGNRDSGNCRISWRFTAQ